MREYELFLVFKPSLEDDALDTAISRLTDWLTSREGTITYLERRGRRRLAYLIDRQREGFDVLAYFTLPAPRLQEFDAALRINEDVLRYLIVVMDPKKMSKPQPRPAPAAAAPAPTPAAVAPAPAPAPVSADAEVGTTETAAATSTGEPVAPEAAAASESVAAGVAAESRGGE